jgi:peroxisomal membrane protein 2
MMSLSKPENDNIIQRIVRQYLKLLREKPLLTKACTSACTATVGSLLSQYVSTPAGRSLHVNWRNVLAFALTGFLFVGPVLHNFYQLLEQLVPKNANRAALKRLLIDRFLFTPFFLIVYLYCLSLFEGHGLKLAKTKVDQVFLMALKMNWKVLTIIQYVNINYVPQQYRLLVGNVISLAWNSYIALKRSAGGPTAGH